MKRKGYYLFSIKRMYYINPPLKKLSKKKQNKTKIGPIFSENALSIQNRPLILMKAKKTKNKPKTS